MLVGTFSHIAARIVHGNAVSNYLFAVDDSS